MHRVLWITVALCCATNCYTVLRHPEVENVAPAASAGGEYRDDFYSYDDLAAVQDCRACHDGWNSRPILTPYPPAWDDYYQAPWWTRDDRKQQRQGGALANDRVHVPGPMPVPVLLPPATLAPGAVTVTPAIKPAPARGAAPVLQPRPEGDPQAAPDSTAPEPPAPATTRQGRGLDNQRRSPKP